MAGSWSRVSQQNMTRLNRDQSNSTYYLLTQQANTTRREELASGGYLPTWRAWWDNQIGPCITTCVVLNGLAIVLRQRSHTCCTIDVWRCPQSHSPVNCGRDVQVEDIMRPLCHSCISICTEADKIKTWMADVHLNHHSPGFGSLEKGLYLAHATADEHSSSALLVRGWLDNQ